MAERVDDHTGAEPGHFGTTTGGAYFDGVHSNADAGIEEVGVRTSR